MGAPCNAMSWGDNIDVLRPNAPTAVTTSQPDIRKEAMLHSTCEPASQQVRSRIDLKARCERSADKRVVGEEDVLSYSRIRDHVV